MPSGADKIQLELTNKSQERELGSPSVPKEDKVRSTAGLRYYHPGPPIYSLCSRFPRTKRGTKLCAVHTAMSSSHGALMPTVFTGLIEEDRHHAEDSLCLWEESMHLQEV